jgi:DNA-binding YbaB/EbfC family protein
LVRTRSKNDWRLSDCWLNRIGKLPTTSIIEFDLLFKAPAGKQTMTGKGQGFGFGLGKMKELAEAFKKAQQVQEGARQLQEELEQMEIQGESGNGLIKVVVSGNQEPLRVEISPDALGEGAEVLSDLITVAMKDAYAKSTTKMRERMEDLTSGLELPGF